MKKSILSLIALIFCLVAFTQDKVPDFGKIDKADLGIKDCHFEPGAEAMVLLDLGEVNFVYIADLGWQSEQRYRVRIIILKASGIHHAEIKLHYYSKNRTEEISGIHGVSFNLDANGNVEETKLEKQSIYNKPVDKEFDEVSFAIPNVRIGTVFEYKYIRTTKSFAFIPSWYFQQSIPVRYSAYNIFIPEYFQFKIQIIRRQPMEREKAKSSSPGSLFVMRDIPSLKEEPYSNGMKNYLQRVEFQLSKIESGSFYQEYRNTWPKIINDLLDDEDFGGALKKNLKGTSGLEEGLTGMSSVKDKVGGIYKYVQQNMQWDKTYSLYSEKGTREAWNKRSGSVTDINFILIKLLRDAGVDAKPLLVSTKEHGTINTLFPFLHQFNGVLAYVKDGEDIYVMNAADKYNPFDQVPYDVLRTNALIVDKEEGGLIGLRSGKKFAITVFLKAITDENGRFSGEALLSSSGYARNISMHRIKQGDIKEKQQNDNGFELKIDSLSLANEKDESMPLEQKIIFSSNMQVSGEYLFLPVSLFSGIGKNPFISEERVMDIDFDYPRTYVISGSYILSDQYTVNALPRNTKMILPDTSIVLSRIIQQTENIISFRVLIDFKSTGYSADSYPYIKEFYKKMHDILDERIVLKKK